MHSPALSHFSDHAHMTSDFSFRCSSSGYTSLLYGRGYSVDLL